MLEGWGHLREMVMENKYSLPAIQTHCVVRSAYWTAFNSLLIIFWMANRLPTIRPDILFSCFSLLNSDTCKRRTCPEIVQVDGQRPCPAPCHAASSTVPLRCAACNQPFTAYNCFSRLKELRNANWGCKIGWWRLLKVKASDLDATPISVAHGTSVQQLSSLDTNDNHLQIAFIITFWNFSYVCLETHFIWEVLCLDLTHQADFQPPVLNSFHCRSVPITLITFI